MSFFRLAVLFGKWDKEECTNLIFLSRWMGRQGGREDAVIWRDQKGLIGLEGGQVSAGRLDGEACSQR